MITPRGRAFDPPALAASVVVAPACSISSPGGALGTPVAPAAPAGARHQEMEPDHGASRQTPRDRPGGEPGSVAVRSGTRYVVDPNAAGGCSDRAPGNARQPRCTIGRSAATLGPGATVVVRPGAYRESISALFGTEAAPVTYQ